MMKSRTKRQRLFLMQAQKLHFVEKILSITHFFGSIREVEERAQVTDSLLPSIYTMADTVVEEHDSAWDDPLPHALSPVKFYLSGMKKGYTKAVAIFVHGRGDNIDDMVQTFLPYLSKRYNGKESRLDDDDADQEGLEDPCKVAVIGLEARDNSWYPASHNASSPQEVSLNAPYQYSSLYKIRQAILLACSSTDLQPEHVILIGFSQGANLANTYLHSGLAQLEKDESKDSTVPIPGHIIALAGSLFKVPPSFPTRQYLSKEHEEQSKKEEQQIEEQCKALRRPASVINRLICGIGDRFFSQAEIEEAAGTLANDSARVKDLIEVQISVAMEARAPHTITNRMMAAVIEAIDAALAGS
jgi:hypothetical protein